MRSRRGSLRSIAAGAAVALAVAGCGGSGSSGEQRDALTPSAALAAAVEQAEQQTSSRFAMTTSTSGGGASFQMSGEGVFDYAASTGEMTFTLPGAGGELHQRLVGDSLYMQLPNQPDVFYELRLSELVDTSLASAIDPTAGLQVLKQASDDVVEVGRDTQRGTETTHYRGTIPIDTALEALQGPLKQLAQPLLDATELEDVPFDAWIDDEGRLRRMDQTMTLEMPAQQGQSVTVKNSFELYDFGVEVEVVAPPAEQVKDGAPLLDALTGGTGGG